MKTPLAYDALIFDIDNVLVDTRTSYLDSIRWTVEIFLTQGRVPLVPPPRKARTPFFLSAQDVETFKLLGGFNDDWDCCYGLLTYLLSLKPSAHTADAFKAQIDLAGFAAGLPEQPLGVSGIVRQLGRSPRVTIEKIRQIFQEIYLGPKLLWLCEKRKPQSWKKRGLIFKERLIFRKPLLEQLQGMGLKFGIATGRSRFEAVYVLKRFGIRELFESITTMDEVKRAERIQGRSLRKPHPFSVLKTAEHLGEKKRFIYIGDLPDDILAARKAKDTLRIHAVGFPSMAHDPETARTALTAAGADILLEKPRDILHHLRS